MAATSLPALSGPVDQALAQRSLSEAGFEVRAAPYPGAAQWKLSASGRAVSLTVELYDTQQSALSVRKVLSSHW